MRPLLPNHSTSSSESASAVNTSSRSQDSSAPACSRARTSRCRVSTGHVPTDLDELRYLPPFLHDEVHLAVLGISPEVDLAGAFERPLVKSDCDEVLRQPAGVGGEPYAAGGHEAVVDAVDLAVGGGRLTYAVGKPLQREEQECLFQMADVFGHGVDTPAPRDGGEAVHGVLACHVCEQVAGQVVEAGCRPDAATAHDALVQDGVPQGAQIVFAVHVAQQQFRVAAGLRVAAEFRGHLRPGAWAGGSAQGLGEREREQDDRQVAAGQVGGQLAAQQVGVAPGQNKPQPLALEPVHEQFPAPQVLDLVEQQVARIVVDAVDRGDQVVVVGHVGEPFVVEVHVATGTLLPEQVHGQERLAATARADDHLDQLIVSDRRGKIAFDVSLCEARVHLASLRLDRIVKLRTQHVSRTFNIIMHESNNFCAL